MTLVFYLSIFLLLFIFTVQLSTVKQISVLDYPNSLLCIFLLYLILGSATFNNDWLAYEELYEGLKPTFDLFYVFAYKIFNFFSISYQVFYTTNQLVIYLLIILFLLKFTPKYIFLVVIAMLLLAAPNLSILLRYYTAFSFFLISIYNLKISNNKFIGYVMLFLSVIAHFGAAILFGFLILYKYLTPKNGFKYVLIAGILLAIFKAVIFGILSITGFASFSYYVEEQSSFIGGVFASLPYLPLILIVYARHIFLLKTNPLIKEDKKYVFLYKLSSYPILFLFIALSLQVILHRYIEPFTIIWCAYLLYSVKFARNTFGRFRIIVLLSVAIAVSFYFKYVLPLNVLGESEWIIHYLEILNSNQHKLFKITDF